MNKAKDICSESYQCKYDFYLSEDIYGASVTAQSVKDYNTIQKDNKEEGIFNILILYTRLKSIYRIH